MAVAYGGKVEVLIFLRWWNSLEYEVIRWQRATY